MNLLLEDPENFFVVRFADHGHIAKLILFFISLRNTEVGIQLLRMQNRSVAFIHQILRRVRGERVWVILINGLNQGLT